MLLASMWASSVIPACAMAQNGLVTADPSAVAAGGCQVQSWYAHDGGARAFVDMPVCSASDKPTLGGQFGAMPASLEGGWNVGASAKFADPDWQLGNTRWGLKVSTSMQGAGLAPSASLLGLASMELPMDMRLRLNVGPKLDGSTNQLDNQVNAALMWPLDERMSLTSETVSSQGAAHEADHRHQPVARARAHGARSQRGPLPCRRARPALFSAIPVVLG